MNEQQLQDIKQRAEKATLGPWKVYQDSVSTSIGTEFMHPQLNGPMPVISEAYHVGGAVGIYIDTEDAEFIAHAREDVPALIAEVEKQRKQASFYYEQFINSSEVIQDLTEKLDQVERAEVKRRQVMLGWRRSWKRKRKEAKVLAKACRKHIEHAAKVEQENERLREALKQILEDEAPNCDGYETFIHATARKALEGESNAL